MRAISFSSSGWTMIGATYLISNLFSFSHLIVLYYYLELQWILNSHKSTMNEAVKTMFLGGDINIIFGTIFGTTIQYDLEIEIE